MSESQFANLIEKCRTEFDLYRACADVGERNGFEYFSIIRMPEKGETKLADVAMATNWPISYIRQYDELGLLENSPIIKALQKSAVPVVWSLEQNSLATKDQKTRQAYALLAAHNIRSSIYFNVHSASGTRGAVAFGGDRPPVNETEMSEMAFQSNIIFDKTCALTGLDNPDKPVLSKRERECIIWTSHGKTSYEIGVILGLSEHTINNYLANVCRKLGAVNRAHLVGIALRKNILG